MIRDVSRLLVVGCALALAACATAPLHYYTLIAPVDAAAGPAIAAAGVPFEVLPVGLPAQVDQPQLVVREGGQGVALLDGERWIAPLADEIRGALSADLARDLHSQDMSGQSGSDKPRLQIKLDLRRFDSQPASYALIEGSWSVRWAHGSHPAVLVCTSQISEPVGPGYEALVAGHQRALGRLAAQIAGVARLLGNGQPASCPAP